jgi:hypothetical protein
LNIQTKYRAETAQTLCHAISMCDPQDAAQIMAAALETLQIGQPEHDVFGTVRRDAEWWAEVAPPHEVQAYVAAGLKQLQAKAIGPKARKALIVHLWNGMTAADKAAFLKAIGGAA